MRRWNTPWRKLPTEGPSPTAKCRYGLINVMFISALLLLSLLSGACVTQGTYDELLVDRDSTAQREANLKAQVAQLERKIDLLQTTSESLSDERSQLIDEMETLSLEREVMESSLRSLQEAREELSLELSSRTSELDKRNEELEALSGTYTGLVEDLESEVAAGRIQIEQLREGVRLNLPQAVLFGIGSAELAPEGVTVLHKVAGRINTNEYRVEVQGHTDNLGIHGALARRYPTNWELAGARATRVARLLEEGGVDPGQLTAVSMGSHQPVASNENEEGRALNRRIEIRLLRIQGTKAVEEAEEAIEEAIEEASDKATDKATDEATDATPAETQAEATDDVQAAPEPAAEKNAEKDVEGSDAAE